MLKYIIILVIGLMGYQAEAQEVVALWAGGPPDLAGSGPAHDAFLTVYPADSEVSTGTGVVICPGGGYGHLAMDHEGHDVARWLNSLGVDAFILKYRHAPEYGHPTPLRDAQRALRLVRVTSESWGMDLERLGILGFSAGGHLASSAGTHFEWEDPLATDEIASQSARPDFMILLYPVISFNDDITHQGSKRNLIGENPSQQLVTLYSNELQVSTQTPPTFLMHTTEDQAVPVENSIVFYQALRKAGVDAEMHIYEKGRHGVGLAPDDPVLSSWPDRAAGWMRQKGWLGE